MSKDRFRPRFHFTAPTAYLNDPNGLIQIGDTYHLFYQYSPKTIPEGCYKDWGHAVSRDLVTWEDREIALKPMHPGCDSLGCWSGCAIEVGEEVRLYYTGIDEARYQQLCLARCDLTLEKFSTEAEPLTVEGRPSSKNFRTFRDPFVWREGERWRALIGGAAPDEAVPDGIIEMSSDDGIAWKVVRQKLRMHHDPRWVVECPNRFMLDGREVLLCSAQPLWAPLYVLGTDAAIYSSKDLRLLTSSSRFYAPLTFEDTKGRRIMFAYCEESRTMESSEAAGWCNCLSLPMQLSLVGDQLVCHPLEELTKLRSQSPVHHEGFSLGEAPVALKNVRGDQFEIECELELGDAEKIDIDVLVDPSGREFTRIEVDARTGGLLIDNSHCSLDPSTVNQGGNDRQGPEKTDWKHLPSSGRLTLRIFVDHSIVDVFSNGGAFVTQRAYPSLSESTGVRISAQGKGAKLIQATQWAMGEMVSRP
jgi:beta-fructofuranosidase